MKTLIPYTVLLLFSLISVTVHSQSTASVKPQLFNSFPDKLNCSVTELSKAFTATIDQNINLSFSDNFLFSGKVISNVIKYTNLQTIVIKSTLFGNAIFVLSKIKNRDNSIVYAGHIINAKYFDGYELKKDVSDYYQLIKIETDKVIPDCSQN